MADDLTYLALGVLEDAAAAACLGPISRTYDLGLALAWLQVRSGSRMLPQTVFVTFWEDLDRERDDERLASINFSLNTIYQLLGIPRDDEHRSSCRQDLRDGECSENFVQALMKWVDATSQDTSP